MQMSHGAVAIFLSEGFLDEALISSNLPKSAHADAGGKNGITSFAHQRCSWACSAREEVNECMWIV